MPNWTTPAAGVDEVWMLKDLWQREHRTMSSRVDGCDSDEVRGDARPAAGELMGVLLCSVDVLVV